MYDKNNVFAKILKGDLAANIVDQNEHAIAFEDINPQGSIHLLIIPRGEYVDVSDFCSRAKEEEMIGFMRLMGKLLEDCKGRDGKLMVNFGKYQEVPHVHMHLIAD